MNWKEKTIKTYDDSSKELEEYFKGIGPRVKDIELGFKLATPVNNPLVVEVGCGDGRDAFEITKRTNKYIGFDPSEGMLGLAKKKLPNIKFEVADALGFHYPSNTHIVFSFASLLHSNKEEVRKILKKVHQSLDKNGIFFISLKEREQYEENIKKDKYGERLFYFYNPDTIKKLAGNMYSVVHEDHQTIGKTKWFTVTLKKS